MNGRDRNVDSTLGGAASMHDCCEHGEGLSKKVQHSPWLVGPYWRGCVLSAQEATVLARSVKEHERRAGQKEGFSAHPGDCLAYKHYRDVRTLYWGLLCRAEYMVEDFLCGVRLWLLLQCVE